MKAQNNVLVREAALRNGIFLWQIAKELGVADSTCSRKLREELSPEETQNILAIIGRLSGNVK